MDSTVPLQSGDRKAVMDVIDKLRSIGINQHVNLPEIVVCGDQSSGKSSVLQAISGMTFPAKDSLCTRFATELVLRHTEQPVDDPCRVTIIPGKDCSSEERKRLEGFRASHVPEDNNIAPLVDKAMSFMGIGDQGVSFGSDVLRIEISGPDQPHLTIVDLPGLFRAGNKEQNSKDAEIVRSIVRGYMKNPRSVILAVVSASSNFVLQEVTEMASKIDSNGNRTLGLITKPDLLEVGSKSETDYFELAQNTDVYFRLGWHVLRNRSFASRDVSNTERDESEAEFLGKGIWAGLPDSQKGAAALKVRLSEVLLGQILEQLPEVLKDVENGIQNCSTSLGKIGQARGTIQEQRRYLLDASQRFSSLVKAAVSGVYHDRFFGDARVDEGYHKRLRAVVQNLLSEFAEMMRRRGEARKIVDGELENEDDYETATVVSRRTYLRQVGELMRRTRGCELPGTYNPLIVGELFREQCRPWRHWIEMYSRKVLKAAHWMIEATLQHVFDETTKQGIWTQLVGNRLESLQDALRAKSSEILELFENAHPITYNHYLTENVQKAQVARVRKDIENRMRPNLYGMISLNKDDKLFSANDILEMVTTMTEANMETYANSSATDMMEAYYKVALKRTIDDFSSLAIEACLVSKLPDLLTPHIIFELNDEQVRMIAEENKETTKEREALTQKVDILTAGLTELRRLSRLHKRWTADGTAHATHAEVDGVGDNSLLAESYSSLPDAGEVASMSCEEEEVPVPYEEEAAPVPYEEEDVPVPYEEEDVPVPYEEEAAPMSYKGGKPRISLIPDWNHAPYVPVEPELEDETAVEDAEIEALLRRRTISGELTKKMKKRLQVLLGRREARKRKEPVAESSQIAREY